MTEFDNWALNWYDKNEKKEDLKSSNLDTSAKRDRIKVIREEVVDRLNLVLKSRLSKNIKQEISYMCLYSQPDYYKIRYRQISETKERIENDIRILKKKLSKLKNRKDMCEEWNQSEQNDEQSRVFESLEEAIANNVNAWMDVDVLLDEYKKCIDDYSQCIKDFRQIKVDDGDVKGEENNKRKMDAMEREREKHIKKYHGYGCNDDISTEFLKIIDDDEINLFELLLSNIKKKDIASLKKDMWEILSLELREQIVELIDKIIQNENNLNRKVWLKYEKDMEEISIRLFHPEIYRITEKMKLLKIHLRYFIDVAPQYSTYSECFLNVEKCLTKAIKYIEKFNDEQDKLIANKNEEDKKEKKYEGPTYKAIIRMAEDT